MNLYGYRDFGTLHFGNLYNAVTTLFMVMTNGWSGALAELKSGAPEVNPIFTDLYLFSFFIFSVMITLNVFVSVMASHVQSRMEDKLEDVEEDVNKIEQQEQRTEKLLLKLKEEQNCLREEIRQKEKSPQG